MIAVVVLVLCYWACSGAVASIKAARATQPATTTPNGTQPKPGSRLNPGAVTFGQWQRSLYRRWKTKTRAHLPGQHLGRKLADLFGDVTAASLAGAAIFGMGFVSGATWTAKKRTARAAQAKTQRRPGTPKSTSAPGGRWRQPRNPRPGTPPGGAAGFNPGRRRTAQDQTPPRGANADDNTILDFELLDVETPTTTANSGQFSSTEYADVVLPELPAHPTASITAPNGHAMAAEILTIHHLLRWAQGTFEHAANVIEQSAVRARSALDRASHALVRSNTAIARRDTAVAVADTAQQHAAQLEATAARFSTLRMDPASMTSIGVGITTAVGLAQAEQRRAEAEAEVARWSAGLAAAEQTAAEAAQASAQAAAVHAEAVKNMHDTVRRNQMPHAEALAATGNDAAHPSVLAAG
ncbi:hypothetical protein [Mycobacterium sp.]|uniref:hypothetical protein n=1 Tax=Mycobacterium sp. TaxID=1785 RepID=UPI00262CD9D2|nr:hypothetical protein [Mycobacterium sp.]